MVLNPELGSAGTGTQGSLTNQWAGQAHWLVKEPYTWVGLPAAMSLNLQKAMKQKICNCLLLTHYQIAPPSIVTCVIGWWLVNNEQYIQCCEKNWPYLHKKEREIFCWQNNLLQLVDLWMILRKYPIQKLQPLNPQQTIFPKWNPNPAL